MAGMSDCGCKLSSADTAEQRRTISIALALNATMFVVGTVAALVADSTGLLADALDMLADSSVYAIALLAIGRSIAFKSRGARVSGGLLAILGLGVVIESVRRAVMGAEPEGWIIVGIATMSLLVNATVLRMLAKYRDGEVHLRASWIFTRADVIANLGVIVAGLLVLGIGAPWPDFVIGAGIGLYVIREAVEILRDPRQQDGTLSAIKTAGS
jgi:Co/Zn/Cd efflux system component